MEADLLNELEQLSVEELEERLSGHLNAADAYMIEARAIASKSAIEVFRGGRVAFVLRELLKEEKEWEKWLRDHPRFKRSTVNRAIRFYEAVIAAEGNEAEQALTGFTPMEAYRHYLPEFKTNSKKAMSQNGTSEAGSAQSPTHADGDQGPLPPNELPPWPIGMGDKVPDHLPYSIRCARQFLRDTKIDREVSERLAWNVSDALLREAIALVGWEKAVQLLIGLKGTHSVAAEVGGGR